MLPIIYIALLPYLVHATGEAREQSTSLQYGRIAAAACCDLGRILAENGVRK